MAARAPGFEPHGGAPGLIVRRAAALTLLLMLPALPRAEESRPLGPCGPVDRPYDAVELPASALHRLGGTPIPRLGVLAARGGRLGPIPFQVDERRGRKIALPGGREPSSDDKPGILDADDLLVFMACDAGEQLSAADLAAALGAAGAGGSWREVRIEDPLRHTSGFVYVVVADPPRVTADRYVTYDPGGDLVRSARYRIGMVNALPTYFALASPGGVTPNLIDGLRLRAEATLRADLAHWRLNEQQGHHELIAWKVGPVRVIRRSRHQVVIGLGIHLTAGVANTYFYPRHVYGPGSLRLPFSPGILFREISAYGAVDGRDLRGWRYHAPGAPEKGLLVDGHMDEVERAFSSDGDWFVLAHQDDALLFVTRLSENLKKAVSLRLLYRDDASRPNAPESVPGTVPLAGYEGHGVEKVPGGRYTFALHIFVLDRYRRGDEKPILAALDAPVTAETTAEGTLSAPAAPAAGPAAPR